MFPTIITENIFAATTAISSSDFEKINLSNPPVSDSSYEFVLGATSKSDIIWDAGDLDLIKSNGDYRRTWLGEAYGQIFNEIQYNWYTKNDSLGNGQLGFTITNVGTYNGKELDLHCTYYWDNEKTEGVQIYQQAYICISQAKKYIEFGFVVHSYTIEFEVFEHGTKTPVPINCNLTFNDIDYQQLFGFKINNGSINSMQCASTSRVYYHNDGQYRWFYAGNSGGENDPIDAIRLELKDTSRYTIKFGSGHDKGTSGNYFNSEFADTWNAANVDLTNSGGIDPYFWSSASLAAFNWGTYDVQTPEKYVSDTNETKVTTNTISNNENFTYDIYQRIPAETGYYYYDSFSIIDVLPNCVEYISSSIYNNAQEDITSKFTVTQNGQTIQATLINPKDGSFYNDTINWRITVCLKDNTIGNFKITDNHYQFTNKATVIVDKVNGHFEKESNVVTSNYYTTFITVTKNWKDNNNAYNSRPSSISYTLKKDGANYKTGTISSTDNWSVTINDLPRYKADGTEYSYTVTENNISLENGDSYVPSYNGLTITNTLTGNKDIVITKIWNDKNNIYGTRPSSINITIMQNGKDFKTVTIDTGDVVSSDSNKWQISVNVPKYDTNGIEYTYTIKEDTTNSNLIYFYETPVYDQSKLTVTNTAQFIPTESNEHPEYKIIIHKSIVDTNGNIADYNDFNQVKLNMNDTYNFAITLKELNRTVTNTGPSLVESYNGYSGNVFNGIVTNKGDLIFNLGDEGYGKYEISENINQYFDFVNIEKLNDEFNTSGASFSKENGKYYITLSGITGEFEQISVKVTNQIKPDRTYNETEDKENLFKI